MAYKIVEKRVIEVSKDEYIKNRKDKLKLMKSNLKQFKIKTTKEINLRMSYINDLEKELRSLE